MKEPLTFWMMYGEMVIALLLYLTAMAIWTFTLLGVISPIVVEAINRKYDV